MRSHRWLGVNDLRSFGHRSRLRQFGYDSDDWGGRPVIAIINTWSEINACHAHLRARENVKRGVLQAGGFPIELPAMSLAEPFVKPSTMLYRNFLAMEAEELLRSHPLDGAVLLGGCDKTTPGLVMGAIGAGHSGDLRPGGSHAARQLAGRISRFGLRRVEILDGEARRQHHRGAVERDGERHRALLRNLHGHGHGGDHDGDSRSARPDATRRVVHPGGDSGHPRMCGAAGRRIVDMVWEDLTPDRILTPAAFDNAIKVHMAMGGSTNAIIHVIAMARRAGIAARAVIDSIQTLYSDALQSAPGSVAQVRECAAQLTRIAKGHGIALIFVGHVTKEGALAGPRVLEHIVDTVLYFEGDPHSSFRLIRAFKNRFGPVNELGVFAMTERGLRGVANPSALFLSHHREPVAGSCILATSEGTRPLLVEVQALVDGAQGMTPRRLAQGLDQGRLAMLLAVLHRHARWQVQDQDVFVNAVGGVRIAEPAADLAVVLAVLSSFRNRPLPEKLVVFGEVGLAGEVRPAPRGQDRLREAAKLGFRRALIPRANAPKQTVNGIEVVAIERLTEAIAELEPGSRQLS